MSRGGGMQRSAEAAAVIPPGLPPTGPAGGDLGGTYPDPQVNQSSDAGGFEVLGLGGLTVLADANILGNTILGDNALTTVLISGNTQMNGDLVVTGAGSFVSIGAAPAGAGALRLSASDSIAWNGNGIIEASGILYVAAVGAWKMALEVGGMALLTSAGSYGGGANVVFLVNRTTAPTSDPVGGGIIYEEAGALMHRGSSGTVTTIAPA